MADANTQLQITKPYTALNIETYRNIRQHELATCKKIGYEFYCKELLWLDTNPDIVVKVQFTLT